MFNRVEASGGKNLKKREIAFKKWDHSYTWLDYDEGGEQGKEGFWTMLIWKADLFHLYIIIPDPSDNFY